MKNIVLVVVLMALITTGCGWKKVGSPTSEDVEKAEIKSEIQKESSKPDQSSMPVQKVNDQGLLPEPFTVNDQIEIEQVIRKYFNALENKDFGTAYDMWAKPIVTKEQFVTDYSEMNIEHVKIVSVRKYKHTPTGQVEEVSDSVLTPYFDINLIQDFKTKESTPNEVFPNIKKNELGQWKIFGLGTSP